MTPRPYILHALSPLHAGVGQAAELIDLPIARMKGTGIPFVPGSSIKGVLRDARTSAGDPPGDIKSVFGPDKDHASEHSGALICCDARLLALPVRSFRGTFAYVTSPLLLMLAARDLTASLAVPGVSAGKVMVAGNSKLAEGGLVYLEDLDLPVQGVDNGFNAWTTLLEKTFPSPAVFTGRFAVVDDETMTFLWETATQLDQRVSINPDTRYRSQRRIVVGGKPAARDASYWCTAGRSEP